MDQNSFDSATVYNLVNSVISSIDAGNLSEETIQRLKLLFPDELITAAFDLIDRQCVIKYSTTWGRRLYEVQGSTTQYSVFPAIKASPSRPVFCSCPTFAHSLTFEDDEAPIMCKHLLATQLAIQMKRCVERTLSEDELAAIMSQS